VKEVTLQTHALDKYRGTLASVHLSATLEPTKGQSMGPVRAGLLGVILMVATEVWGQVSIGSLRSSADSSNLELVTLQGEVHLSRSRQIELGGRCGNTTFTLQDDTGSIEVAIRRSNRLIEPLKEGDRVRLTAQIRVFHNRENVPVLICVQATEIQHLDQ
jgi:DNA/RNA endonuclease YhcR with UshA esterase domain